MLGESEVYASQGMETNKWTGSRYVAKRHNPSHGRDEDSIANERTFGQGRRMSDPALYINRVSGAGFHR